MSARVLIVEDDPDFAASLELALDLVGLTATIAGSAEQAYEIMESQPTDIHLGFFDVKLPQEDGISCFEKISGAHSTFAGVIMTGFRDEKTLDRARAAGVLDVLLKPFRMSDFLGLARKYAANGAH